MALFRSQINQKHLFFEPDFFTCFGNILVFAIKAIWAFLVFFDVDSVPLFFVFSCLDIDKQPHEIPGEILSKILHELTMVQKVLINHKALNIAFVIIFDTEFYLLFPIKFLVCRTLLDYDFLRLEEF